MVADMVAFVASQFTTSTWDVGAQELCSVVLISCENVSCNKLLKVLLYFSYNFNRILQKYKNVKNIISFFLANLHF